MFLSLFVSCRLKCFKNDGHILSVADTVNIIAAITHSATAVNGYMILRHNIACNDVWQLDAFSARKL